MSIRALGPWLLTGALLASIYGNLAWYRNQNSSASDQPAAVGGDPAVISAFHFAPTVEGQSCPTLDLLELTDEQRDRIRKCSLSSLDLRTDLAIEIQGASTELQQLLSVEVIEGDRILELADRISSLRSAQYKAWIGTILVVRDVLTPEQLQRLHELESD